MNGANKFNWTGWLVFGLFLLLWEFVSRSSPSLQLYIPPVSQVIVALSQLIVSGQLAAHLLTTLRRFLEGYLLAAAIAVTLGVVLGYFRLAHSLLETLIEFLRPMPSVAIVPVAILLLGIGDAMIVAVTVYASAWPILINTIDGVRHIERTLVDTGRTFGLARRRILWEIILPAASPYIVTGLRVSLSIALILVTTAEMIAGSQGLGFFILDEERSLRSRAMYAGIILVAMLGYLLNRLFLALEEKAMKWHRGMVTREAV
ncbi:MAG TPA: ABC transporter permease [Candidatus Binatia bacterium]|nr:ABC transporter permease [Candidatus Binatia bacterium]